MKNVIIFFSVLITVFSESVLSADDFTGRFSGKVNNEDGSVYSTLTLKIKQEDRRLSGRYCYVTRGGRKIDCPDDNVDNMNGVVENNTAIIYFNSSFGGLGGKASLNIKENKLIWDLIQEPKDGEFYAPQSYELTREDDRKTTLQKIKVLSTKSFTVTLVSNCGDFYASCQDVKYYGMKNKDNSQISLSGYTVNFPGTNKVKGMLFKNGGVEYLVSFEPLRLKISQGEKVLAEQDGKWE